MSKHCQRINWYELICFVLVHLKKKIAVPLWCDDVWSPLQTHWPPNTKHKWGPLHRESEFWLHNYELNKLTESIFRQYNVNEVAQASTNPNAFEVSIGEDAASMCANLNSSLELKFDAILMALHFILFFNRYVDILHDSHFLTPLILDGILLEVWERQNAIELESHSPSLWIKQ